MVPMGWLWYQWDYYGTNEILTISTQCQARKIISSGPFEKNCCQISLKKGWDSCVNFICVWAHDTMQLQAKFNKETQQSVHTLLDWDGTSHKRMKKRKKTN